MNIDTNTTTSRLPLAIDRRPVRMISCWTGDYEHDRLGLASWWANDSGPVARLLCRLKSHYDQGYRRFMLILPAGYPRGQTLMPSSQWLTMSERRRECLVELMPGWKSNHPDIELYVYMGTALADPTSLVMPSQAEAKTPSIVDDWQWYQDNLRGWIDCGVTGFGFDNASNPKHVKSFVETAQVLAIAGIKCIGEAIPTWELNERGGKLRMPKPGVEVYRAPFFALDQFIEQRDPERRWRFDPRTTECGVGLRDSMKIAGQDARVPVTEELIRNFVQRGLIPYVYSSKWDEVVGQIERERLATDPPASDTGEAR